MKIAIMGSGGLGGYLGAQLARAGRDVTFIARGEHLHAIRTSGLQVHSRDGAFTLGRTRRGHSPARGGDTGGEPAASRDGASSPARGSATGSAPGASRDGDFLVNPAQATADPAALGPVDLVLFCVKQYDADSAAEQIRPLIGSQTAVIPVLNGIDHIERLAGILGAEHILGGMAIISAHLAGPGIIQHDASNVLTFGEMSGEMSARCLALRDVLAVSGIQATAVPDIVVVMWNKLIVQAAGAVCSVVRGGSFVVRSAPETIQLMRQAAAESFAVARAKNVPVESADMERLVNSFLTFPTDLRLAMLVDLEHGRRLELDWMTGIISRYGKALGVPTPANDFIYACLKPWANGTPARS